MSSAIAKQRFRDTVAPLFDDAYSLAKWLSRSPTDAEDIVQDAALRALQALSTVSVDRPKPWFLRYRAQLRYDLHGPQPAQDFGVRRRSGGFDALDLREGDYAAPNPEQELIALEDGERLRNAIAALPSPFLETLVMRDITASRIARSPKRRRRRSAR